MHRDDARSERGLYLWTLATAFVGWGVVLAIGFIVYGVG